MVPAWGAHFEQEGGGRLSEEGQCAVHGNRTEEPKLACSLGHTSACARLSSSATYVIRHSCDWERCWRTSMAASKDDNMGV